MMDTFETALLSELRREVATSPATYPSPLRRPTRRRRYAVASLATGAAAAVAAVVGFTTLGGSPAYAVETDSSGDVVVTVHRLDDADGLERALAAEGVDADVSYDPEPATGTGAGPGALPTDGAGSFEQRQVDRGKGTDAGGETGPGTGDDPCGFGDSRDPVDAPASLAQDGDDWVLSIPAGSPLLSQGRHLDVGTDADGVLTVSYEGSEPGSHCALAQLSSPLR